MEQLLRSTGPYAILDVDSLEARGLAVAPAAQAMLGGGASVLQLRAKGRSARQTLEWLEELVPLAAGAGVPLFVNDRADLAAVAGAPGVHVGQDDLPLTEVRRLFPELRVGVSTHSLEQLEAALAERPDYVAFGPVFPTRSKAQLDPLVGLELLASAATLATAAAVPLVAIGGIDSRNAHQVRATGAVPAVIAALLPELAVDAPEPALAVIYARTRALCVGGETSGPA